MRQLRPSFSGRARKLHGLRTTVVAARYPSLSKKTLANPRKVPLVPCAKPPRPRVDELSCRAEAQEVGRTRGERLQGAWLFTTVCSTFAVHSKKSTAGLPP